MKNVTFFTIQKQNYLELESALKDSNLPAEALNKLKQVLKDHKTVTDAAEKAIRQQLKEAIGLFACNPLIENPVPAPQENSSPESRADEVNNSQEQNSEANEPPKNDDDLKDRADRQPRKPVKRISHTLNPKDLKCPSCHKNMHKAHNKTVTIIRLVGLTEEKHEVETCRCLKCDTSKEAEFAEANEKRIGNFTLDAASMICALRYALGMPSFRLEEFTACMGLRISDSTQWDLFERCADEIHDFIQYLRQFAKKGQLVQMDDTSVRINEMAQMFKTLRNGDVQQVRRTGLHTTGYIAKFAQGKVCLFESGLHHAGEVFEKLNKARTVEDQVILMMDASSSNSCKLSQMDVKVIQANCNSHALRKFKELEVNAAFEEHVSHILELYGSVFENDRKTRDCSPTERLMLHQKQSLPKMLEIKLKIESDFLDNRVEPNSPLGSAYKYFLNHFEKLTACCKYERAPVCNNECERLLKRAIRHRKNSLFFKNSVGAAVGDIHMSVLLTAKENGLNPVHYLAALFKFEKERKQNPEDFLPWNFTATLERLKLQLPSPLSE
ncbi:MAG: hypothetical protein RJB13_328 [Pseudomonadota bacterium]